MPRENEKYRIEFFAYEYLMLPDDPVVHVEPQEELAHTEKFVTEKHERSFKLLDL
jgi:hypothetical protein